MLVLRQRNAIQVITQNDHARLAHDFLSLWTADGLPEHPLRDHLLLATAEHDNGWREADAAPLTDLDTGWPSDFRSYPETDRRRLWQRGVDRFAETDPLVALLILRHAQRIHRELYSSPAWREFFSTVTARQRSLEETCNTPSAVLDGLYEFMWLADTISLGACGALGVTDLDWRGYEFSVSPGQVSVHPFPFAGRSTLRVAYRSLPVRSYSGTTDLGGALANAQWQFRRVRIGHREQAVVS